MPDTYCENGEGLLLISNGIDLPLVWDGYASQAYPAGIVRPTNAVVGAPLGSGALNGTYIAYVSFFRADQFESSFSDVSASFTLTDAQEVAYTDIPTSPDPRVIGRRIYRTLDQESLTVYLDVEIDDNTSTTAFSDLDDPTLAQQIPFALLTQGNVTTTLDHEPPPSDKPFVAWHLERAYAAGYEDYAEGSCEVQLGSSLIQGRGTEWCPTFVGRNVYIAGGDATYQIAAVDVVNQIITTTNPYLGDTNLFAAYSIRPDPGVCNTLNYTLPSFLEAWPPLNGLAIPEDDDRTTGLMSMGGYLYILKRQSIYRLTVQSDPATDGFVFLSVHRGCINNRCWVTVGDAALFLDERGVHSFDGSQGDNDLSTNIQDIFRIGGSTIPINWQASKWFHSVHSLTEQTVRWFVVFRGDYLPRHALAFNYVLNRWWIEEYPRAVGASSIGLIGKPSNTWGQGGERVYLGSDANEMYALTESGPDVLQEKSAKVLIVTAAGIETLVLSGDLPASAVGAPIVVRTGRGRLQTRRVVAITDNIVQISPPWLIQPKEGDSVQIGGFSYQIMTQGLRFAGGEATGERSAEVGYRPVKGQTLDVSWRNDFTPDLVGCCASIRPSQNFGVEEIRGESARVIDASKQEGYSLIQFNSLREGQTDGPRRLQMILEGVAGAGQQSITSIILKGIAT